MVGHSGEGPTTIEQQSPAMLVRTGRARRGDEELSGLAHDQYRPLVGGKVPMTRLR